MRYLKPIIFLIIIAAVITALTTLPIKDSLDTFMAWVKDQGVWGPVMIVLIYIPATVFFIPGSAITLGAGALFGVAYGTAAVSVGSTLGSTLAFLIARFAARNWAEKLVQANPKLTAIDKAVEQNGFKIVLLTRLSPAFPYNILGYFYGVTNVSLRDYFFATWIGMFPGTLLYVYLGSVAGAAVQSAAGAETQKSPAQWAMLIVGAIATLAVTIIVTKIARKAMQDAIPQNDNDDTDPDPTQLGVNS